MTYRGWNVGRSNLKTGNNAGAAGVEAEERMQVAQVASKEMSRGWREGKLEKPTGTRREIRSSGK